MPPLKIDLAYAFGKPSGVGKIKVQASDFIVEEQMSRALAGEGEHLYVHLEKKGKNTHWIAGQLADFLGLKKMDVGFAGMKDRHAVTRQWFSLYAPKIKIEPDWTTFEARFDDQVRILKSCRHTQKLRRGDHDGNAFTLQIKELSDMGDFLRRSELVKEAGCPNYFGDQRFGRDAGNLELVSAWAQENTEAAKKGRRKRMSPKALERQAIVISSARSFLFNYVLSHRVSEGTWRGKEEGAFAELSAPMWGRGRLNVNSALAEYEQNLLQPFASILNKLEHCGSLQARRALAIAPNNFNVEQQEEDQACIKFSLPPGQYATSVLRELMQVTDVSVDVAPEALSPGKEAAGFS